MSEAPKLGIIGGSAFLDETGLEGTRVRAIGTDRGQVLVHEGDDFVVIRRHGEDRYYPPHRIPHHAHVLALESLGVRQVAAFASTGALRDLLQPGDVLVPEDYISMHPPPSFAADEYLHIVPRLDDGVRELLLAAAGAVVEGRPVHEGVYVQTHGPRFETAAEVRMLARDADVVGMTAASEATLCQERGIGYAMICIVDNYANGVGPEPLTLDLFRLRLAMNVTLARRIALELIGIWRERTE